MNYANLTFQVTERIALLSINRPQALNALNRDTLLEIRHAVGECSRMEDVDVLLITGTGDKAFAAGADITYMQSLTALQGREFGLLGQEVFRLVEELEKPSLAAVNGFALGGGCELAMCCDFRIASLNARFGQPEVGLGVIPGFGGTQRLTRLINVGMAKQMLYSGQIIDAWEAKRIGLVNDVVAAEDLLNAAFKLARQIASNSQVAVRLCKNAVNEGLQTDIDRGLTIEADLFGLCFATQDQKEGMSAFLEKRKAVFSGK